MLKALQFYNDERYHSPYGQLYQSRFQRMGKTVREWGRLKGPNRLVDFDKGTSSAHLERIQNGISFNKKIFPSRLRRRCVMCDSFYFVNTNVSSQRQTSERCAFEKLTCVYENQRMTKQDTLPLSL